MEGRGYDHCWKCIDNIDVLWLIVSVDVHL